MRPPFEPMRALIAGVVIAAASAGYLSATRSEPVVVAPTTSLTTESAMTAKTASTLPRLWHAVLHDWMQSLRRRRHDTLSQLDERSLRDLGLTPGEIGSVQAEHHGLAEPTRRRVIAPQARFAGSY